MSVFVPKLILIFSARVGSYVDRYNLTLLPPFVSPRFGTIANLSDPAEYSNVTFPSKSFLFGDVRITTCETEWAGVMHCALSSPAFLARIAILATAHESGPTALISDNPSTSRSSTVPPLVAPERGCIALIKSSCV